MAANDADAAAAERTNDDGDGWMEWKCVVRTGRRPGTDGPAVAFSKVAREGEGEPEGKANKLTNGLSRVAPTNRHFTIWKGGDSFTRVANSV